MSNIIKYNH